MLFKRVLLVFCIIFVSNENIVAQDNKGLGIELNSGQLDVSGLLQTRYEYTIFEDSGNLSSFYLRRIRLDFRGHLLDERITYRIRPEFARVVTLEDAWINYTINPQAQFRFGLVFLPFHWYRFISSSRHHFIERGVPSELFGFPSGRDFGLLFHGRNESNTLNYQFSITDGAGTLFTLSNSSGHVLSSRIDAAIIGEVPRDETAYQFLDELNMSVGFGIQAANKNEVRIWALDRSSGDNNMADWLSGTSDLSLKWRGFSVTGEGFLRKVKPNASDVDDYYGWAYLVSTGFFIWPQKLELVGRYSDLRLDAEDPGTNESEIGVGLNIYHYEHNVKTRIQYLSQFAQDQIAFGQRGYFVVEVQLRF